MRFFTEYLARWAVLVCLLVTMIPAGMVMAQEETAPPVADQAQIEVATDPPAPTAPPATESPVVVPPTDPPTELPATDPPVTSVPPTVIGTSDLAPTEPATELPPDTVTPGPDVTVSPTDETIELPAASLARAAAPGGPYLTVDGHVDNVFATRGGTQTFVVGDLLDMAGTGFPYIEASNPDPDFYRFIGWATSNTFTVYSGAGCTGGKVREYYTDGMQPSKGTDTVTMSGAVRTYSVQAQQTLRVYWIEKKIDIVDSVDETTAYPITSKSNCVTVEMTVDYITLLANGSTGPITINQGDPIGLQTNQPSGDIWQQRLLETDENCISGTLVTIGMASETVSATISRPPGTYWYRVRSTYVNDAFYSNCVQVTVQATPASLLVEGSAGPVSYVTSQSLSLYVTGFTPGALLTGLVNYGSTTCGSTDNYLTSGVADGTGTLEMTEIFSFVGDLSVQFLALDIGGEVLEATNCVVLLHQDTDIRLLVNGSVGPVLDEDGEIHLIATGLPPGSTAYAVIGCSGAFEPDDFGQTIGDDGVFEAYLSDDLPDQFSIRVALLPPSEVSSNCVSVRMIPYQIAPFIIIDGAGTEVNVEAGEAFTIEGITFPPDAAVTLRSFSGVGNCEGISTTSGAESDYEGNFAAERSISKAGLHSVLAEAGGYVSNCITIEVTAAPPTEVPVTEVPVTEVPTGPVTLRANGQTDPQTVVGGVQVELTAEGLLDGEAYSLAWFASNDCSGTARALGNGQASGSPVGALTRYIASTVTFQLTAGNRTSNCVQVAWLAIPATATVIPTEIPTEPVETEVPTEPGETEVPIEPTGTETPVGPTEAPVTEVPVTEVPTDPAETEVPTDPAGTETPAGPTEAPNTPGSTATATGAVTVPATGGSDTMPGAGGSGMGSTASTTPGSTVGSLPVTGHAANTFSWQVPLLLLAAAVAFVTAAMTVRRRDQR